jgi:hypothetical protein
MEDNIMRNAILLVVLLPALAGAGTVNLRSGSMDFEDPMIGDSAVHMTGSRGWDFEGYAESAWLEAADCAFGCDAGEVISVGLHSSGNDLPGVAELGSQDFYDVGDPSSLAQLDLLVTGQATVPHFSRNVLKRIQRVSAALTGVFWHDGMGDALSSPVTVWLTWQNGGGVWYLDRVQYVVRRR